MRSLVFVLLGLLSLRVSPSAQDSPGPAPTVACDVTVRQRDDGFYATPALGVWLSEDGTIVFRPGGPGFIAPDGSLSMKFPWQRRIRGALTIEGRRLDGAAPPLRSAIPDGYGDTGFQATALIFPTPGCWEVTGRVGGERLTFVTRVVKVDAAVDSSSGDWRLPAMR